MNFLRSVANPVVFFLRSRISGWGGAVVGSDVDGQDVLVPSWVVVAVVWCWQAGEQELEDCDAFDTVAPMLGDGRCPPCAPNIADVVVAVPLIQTGLEFVGLLLLEPVREGGQQVWRPQSQKNPLIMSFHNSGTNYIMHRGLGRHFSTGKFEIGHEQGL